MPTAASRNGLWRCAAGLLAAALGVLSASPVPGVHAQDEVRALWVVRTSLTSPAAVATMVSAARASGFNTLLVQVRGRADAYYAGGVEPRASALTAHDAFDPLATAIALAHEAGLQVHAWINVNLVTGADLPAARDHVAYRHPEWLMVPKALADGLAAVDPHSPEYLGRLARYVRSQPSDLEGLYLSPIPEPASEYTVSVVRDLAARYQVDGVHLDYARYPTDEFDYSRDALEAFRLSIGSELTPDDRRRYDSRAGAEPLIYTETFPERWRLFRSERLTALMARLKEAVKGARPDAIVSAAVGPDPAESSARRLQDWRVWLERDLVDVICPMAYTTDSAVFAAQIDAARAIAGRHPLWAGIGAFRLSSSEILENVQAARRLGVGGIILFSYDSLTGPSHGPNYLAQVGRSIGSEK